MINSFPPLSEKQKKHTIRFYRYLIVGATFAIPLNVHIANGLILSCLLPSIFLWDKKITPHILLIPIFLFFSLAFSLLWTENIKEGLSRMELQINLLLVPLVFYCGRNFIDEKLQKQVEIAFLGAMSIFLIGGYLRVHMDTGKWFFFRDTLESYDIHPGYTSVYVLMCFIILSKSNVNLFEFCLVTAFVFFILIVFSAKNQILT
nr:hypothetical protein [Cyclobacteriaceae bacterium]